MRDTKLNLNNQKFEQATIDVLNLSGTTEVNGVLLINDGNQQEGYVLTSDSGGTATWQAPVITTPSDPDTSVQFNNNGVFSGSSNLTFDNSTRQLNINGDLAISGTSFLRAGTTINEIELGANASATGSLSVAIGCGSVVSNTSAIALGETSCSIGIRSIAIGADSYSDAICGVSLGTFASSSGNSAIAIGNRACAHDPYSIAMGCNADALEWCSIAIGAATISNKDRSIAIGATAYGGATRGIAIGGAATSLGTDSSIAIGVSSCSTGDCSIVLGQISCATNINAIAIGVSTVASANCAIAMGWSADATNTDAIAIGKNAQGSGLRGIAIGYTSNAASTCDIAIGQNSYANGSSSIALGVATNTVGGDSISIGHTASATGICSTAIGSTAKAFGAVSVAIGRSNNADGSSSIAIGNQSCAIGNQAIAIGLNSCACDSSGIAMGQASLASGLTSLAIGIGAQALCQDSAAIGCGAVANSRWGLAIGDTAKTKAGTCLNLAIGYNAYSAHRQQVVIGPNAYGGQLGDITIGVNAATCSTPGFGRSIAIGMSSIAACNSVALGYKACATGTTTSTAIGQNVAAIGTESIAIGNNFTNTTTQSFAVNFGATDHSFFFRQNCCAYFYGNDNTNLGLNTITPTARLDIVATGATCGFRMVDGNQANNYILTSDASGYATWKSIGSLGGSGITGSTNGLSDNGTDVCLGGTLTTNTTIDGAGSYGILQRCLTYYCLGNSVANEQVGVFDLSAQDQVSLISNDIAGAVPYIGELYLDSSVSCCSYIGARSGATNNVRILFDPVNGGMVATDDIAMKGIEYAADYSTNYTNRTLVDKEYVDSIASGLDAKDAVNVATTTSDGDIDLTGGTFSSGNTIDGIVVQDGWRVLIKNQTDPVENGIYIFSASTSGFTRSTDFDGTPSGEVSNGAFMSVITGNTLINTQWILTTADPITIGTSELTFSLLSQQLGITAGSGITVTTVGSNKQISVNIKPNNGLGFDSNQLYVTNVNKTSRQITQASHGFSVGNVISYSGGTYIKSLADGTQDSEIFGIVSAVADTNTFTITYQGHIDTLSGLVANTTYFVSDTVAGQLTATEPTTDGHISKPILATTTTSAGLVLPYRGNFISTGETSFNQAINGLSTSGTAIKLGGSLCENTTITLGSYSLNFAGAPVNYSGDYSGSFGVYSLVDKNYITGLTSVINADIAYISGQTGVAASPDTSVQFNNNGTFSGSSDLTWNQSSLQLDIYGNIALSGTTMFKAEDTTLKFSVGQGACTYSNRSFAIGCGAIACSTATDSIAIGDNAVTSGLTTIAIGARATNFGGNRSIAIGRLACTLGAYGTSIGQCAVANSQSTAIGSGAFACSGFAGGVGARDYDGAAIGKNAKVYGRFSIAIGNTSTVSGGSSIAIGYKSCTPTSKSIAIGCLSCSYGDDSSIAIGVGTISSGDCSIVLGQLSRAIAQDAISIGASTCATATRSIAIGSNTRALTQFTVAIGCTAYADGNAGVAIGRNTVATGSFSTALGNGSQSIGNNSTSMGGAYNNGQAAIAIGYSVCATAANTISIGYQTITSGASSIGIGRVVKAFGACSVAIGCNVGAYCTSGVAIGNAAKVCGNNGIAIGSAYGGTGNANIAMGVNAKVFDGGRYNIVMGTSAQISGCTQPDNSVVLGRQACGFGDFQISIGYKAGCVASPVFGSQRYNHAISIGRQANTNVSTIGQASIALGMRSQTPAACSIAIGFYSCNQSLDSMVIGKNAYTVGGNESVNIGSDNKFCTAACSFALGYNITITGSSNSIGLGRWICINGGASRIAIGGGVNNTSCLTNDCNNSVGFGWGCTSPSIRFAQNGNSYLDGASQQLAIGHDTPTAKIDVSGATACSAFRLRDGSESDGYVLTSDASGYATWQSTGGGSSTLTGNTISGDDSTTAFTINHGCGTRDMIVQVYENQSPWGNVIVAVERPNTQSETKQGYYR